MKVALYYPWVYLTSGAERVIARLAGGSRHEWTIFTNRFEPENTFPEFRSLRVVELAPRTTVRRTIGATAVNCWRVLRQRLPMEEFDALVVVCEGLGDLVTFRNARRPALCVCLTPLRIAYDEIYQQQWLGGRGFLHRFAISAGGALFRLPDRMAWRKYRRAFFISREALRRANRAGLIDGSRAEILHPGLGLEPASAADAFEDFFLLPGRIMWTKNIELGIRAFQQLLSLHQQFRHFQLVVAGIIDVKSRPYFEQLRQLAGGDGRIRFVIHPSDPELASLYGRCRAVLFTAFNEDWGIVPLEAMAYGKPVIAVNRGGPRETVTDGLHGFLEPPEPAAFAARMAELAFDPTLARRMGAAGFEHAKTFRWDTFVDRIDDELDRVAGSASATISGASRREFGTPARSLAEIAEAGRNQS